MKWDNRTESYKIKNYHLQREVIMYKMHNTLKGMTFVIVFTLCSISSIGWVLYKLLRTVWAEPIHSVLVSIVCCTFLFPLIGYSTISLCASIYAALKCHSMGFRFKRQIYKFTNNNNNGKKDDAFPRMGDAGVRFQLDARR